MDNSIQICCIGNRLGITGNDIPFIEKDFFGLKVGESVIQIGNGKENGTIRTDNFSFPIKYVGMVICQFDKAEEMYAFMLSEQNEGKDLFFIYGKSENEIFTEAVYSKKDRTTGKPTGFLRFYEPVFIKAVNN